MKNLLSALLLSSFLAVPAFAQTAPATPIGYLALAVVYKAGKLFGAQILGEAPSMIACMKAAEGTMGRFNEDPKRPADMAINVACIPLPPAPTGSGKSDPTPQSHDPNGLNPEAFQLTAVVR